LKDSFRAERITAESRGISELALADRARGLCSSCRAKRAAELAVFLQEEVVEEVGHAQWVEALVRYMMRPPVSLSRLRFTPGSHEFVSARKGGHDEPELTEDERIDTMDFVARVLVRMAVDWQARIE
jgi:hypothetical protein